MSKSIRHLLIILMTFYLVILGCMIWKTNLLREKEDTIKRIMMNENTLLIKQNILLTKKRLLALKLKRVAKEKNKIRKDLLERIEKKEKDLLERVDKEKEWKRKYKQLYDDMIGIATDETDSIRTIDSRIPKVIYQTSKQSLSMMPPKMKNAVQSFQNLNPHYEYRHYDDECCLEMLISHFGNDSQQVYTYTHLLPPAFKADFWRYCVLYLFGGIYVDVDMVALLPFDRYLLLNYSFITVSERIPFGLYNAFIASRPRHPILRLCINLIMYYVAYKHHPQVPLNFKIHQDLAYTGPILLNRALNHYLEIPEDSTLSSISSSPIDFLKNYKIQLLYYCSKDYISDTRDCREKLMMTKYKEYDKESNQSDNHYRKFFANRKIYS